jgi:ferredoxin--NADP+ reductase
VDEVIAVVRRGPAEVKFEKKEMEYVIDNLDLAALDAEIQRVTPVMQAVHQDPQAARATILEARPKALPKVSDTRFRFEFLASPVRMIGDENGKLTQVEIEDNILVEANGDTKARGTGNKRCLDVETVIFAIGDKVDETFGLPIEWNEFIKNTNPRFPVDGISYEAPAEDVFVGGWSRQASTGLVGYARKDGTNASKAVWQYLQTKQSIEPNLRAVTEKIKSLNKPVVAKEDIKKLEAIEISEAQKRGIEEFKFDTNEEMLQAMGLTVTA